MKNNSYQHNRNSIIKLLLLVGIILVIGLITVFWKSPYCKNEDSNECFIVENRMPCKIVFYNNQGHPMEINPISDDEYVCVSLWHYCLDNDLCSVSTEDEKLFISFWGEKFSSTELEEFEKIQEFWTTKGEHICDEQQAFLDFYCEGY